MYFDDFDKDYLLSIWKETSTKCIHHFKIEMN